jgi:hypothetical protein
MWPSMGKPGQSRQNSEKKEKSKKEKKKVFIFSKDAPLIHFIQVQKYIFKSVLKLHLMSFKLIVF